MSSRPSRQRKRRWCDSVLEAPPGYRQLLTSLQAAREDSLASPAQQAAAAGPADARQEGSSDSIRDPALQLLSKLQAFSSRPYHHGDMEPIKAIMAAADQLAATCPAHAPIWQHCMQAVCELLFMHSSRPLHKQLLSFVRKLPPTHQAVVGQLFQALVMREAKSVLLSSTAQQPQMWDLLNRLSPIAEQQLEGMSAHAPAQVHVQDQVQAHVRPADAAAVLAAPAQLPAAAVTRGFDLAQAAISLLQMPAACAWLQPAGPLLLLSVARSIQTTLSPQQQQQHQQQQEDGQAQQQQQQQHHLTPKTIELVQDAINVMYMVLQYHGQHIASAASAGHTASSWPAAGTVGALASASICESAQSMLCALQGSLLVREALASAAVVVWSAAALPAVPPTTAALAFAAGLMRDHLPPGLVAAVGVAAPDAAAASAGTVSMRAQQLLQTWHNSSLLEQQLAAQGRSLIVVLQDMPLVARVCALRGLLAAMPAAALAGDLGMHPQRTLPQEAHVQQQLQPLTLVDISRSRSSGCSLVMHCALPFALDAARSAPDAPFKFFAMGLLASVLQVATQLWVTLSEQHSQAPAPAAAVAASAESATAGVPAAAPALGALAAVGSCPTGATGSADVLVVPWLGAADAQAIMTLLSSHLDEPVAPVLAKVQESFEALLALIKVQRETAEKLGLEAASTSASMGSGQGTGSAVGGDVGMGNTCGVVSTAAGAAAAAGAGDALLQPDAFLHSTAQMVLALGASRKGRYQPLTALLPHVGASALLELLPALVRDTLEAMQSNLCASAAASFFKALLLQLRTELPDSLPAASAEPAEAAAGTCGGLLQQHVPAGMQAWCRCWLPDVLSALWAQGERARSYVGNYALPMVLQAEPVLLQPMVDIILAAHAADVGSAGAAGNSVCGASDGAGSGMTDSSGGPRNAAAALVVVLRTARRLQLVGDLDVLLPQQQQQGNVASPAELLLTAVSSATAALRTEALELVCVSAKTTAPPGVLELMVAQRWLCLCLRCTGADSRHKSLALWEKLLARQAGAVRAIRARATATAKAGASAPMQPGAAGSTQRPLSAECEAQAERRQLDFLAWMSQTLLDSLYPGAPYERKYFALELMALLLQQWLHTDFSNITAGLPVRRAQGSRPSALRSTPAVAKACAEPFLADLLSPGCVETLLGCVLDSWDKMRVAASRVLELMPSPLPCCETPEQLLPLLTWAVQLLQNPRVRESDAGARILQLLVSKYLVGLGWTLTVAPHPAVAAAAAGAVLGASANADQVVAAAAAWLGSLSAQLRSQLMSAHADMAAASRHGLVHGPLLALKYTVEVLPWPMLASSSTHVSVVVSAAAAAACGLGSTAAAGVGCSSHGSSDQQQQQHYQEVVCGPASAVLHCWVADLVALLTTAADLVKPLLSAQDVNVAANEVEEAEDDTFSDTELDEPFTAATASVAAAAATAAHGAGAGSSLAGAAAAAAAGGLSGPAVQLLISSCWTSWKEASLLIGTLAEMLPLPNSTNAGGRTDTTSGSSSSCKQSGLQIQQQQQLIECAELEQLGSLQLGMLLSMKHNGAVEKSQAGFITLLGRLLESPEGRLNQLPRAWLARCLDRVQEQGQCRDDIVRRSAGLPFAICSVFLSEPVGVPKKLLPYGLQQLLDIASNGSLEEPWPRVHAFNTLRVVFNDSNMAMDSSGYHAAGVVAAINGMKAPAWEVRNAAALTFTALVLRVVGARNIDTRQLKLLKPLNQLAATPAGMHTLSSSSGGSSVGSGIVQGPTAVDFFTRYPQLHAYLLQQLQYAVQQQGGPASSITDAVPPTLFPSLVLLSRLRPQLLMSTPVQASSSADGASSASVAPAFETAEAPGSAALSAAGAANALGLDPAVFVPAVLAVGQSTVLGVRSMAAAALAPLVPAGQLHTVCLHLAGSLAAAAAGNNGNDGGLQQQQQQQQGRVFRQNALHGMLLQLTALLSATSSSSSDQSSNAGSCVAAAALVRQLLPAFVQSCKLFGPSSSWPLCCAVRQAFVSAAGQLLVLAHKHWALVVRQQGSVPAAAAAAVADMCSDASSSAVGLMQQFVLALHTNCLSALQATIPHAAAPGTSSRSSSDLQDPLYSCWLRDCAAMLLGPLLQLELLLHKHTEPATPPHSLQTSSTTEPYADAALMAYQLQLLAHLLPIALQSSSYEVRGAALKACVVHFDRLSAVWQQLQARGTAPFSDAAAGASSSSSAAAAGVASLASCVWRGLQQRQQVKVTKRLLVVWGHIQCLQQLMPVGKLDTSQVQCRAIEDPAAATAAGPWASSQDVNQLSLLLNIAETCREPDARAKALLCAARVAHKLQANSSSSNSAGAAAVLCGRLEGQELSSLDVFNKLLDSFSEPHQPGQLRAAAAEALSLSGLLLPLAQAAAAAQHVSVHSIVAVDDTPCAGSNWNQLSLASLVSWFWAVRLMEDEEEEVRQAAAAAAQQALQLAPPHLLQPLLPASQQPPQHAVGTPPGSYMNSSSCSTRQAESALAGAGAVVPSGKQYVAAVQYSCFALLGRCAVWCPNVQPYLVAHLLRVVFPADTAVPAVLQRPHSATSRQAGAADADGGLPSATAAAAAAGDWGACVQQIQLPGVVLRRLFEREADNHHQEPLLLAQHAAAALRHTLTRLAQPRAANTDPQAAEGSSAYQAEVDRVLSAWCHGVGSGFLPAVVDSLTAPGGTQGQAGFPANDAHHPEVFVPLYRCCLGLWAMGAWVRLSGSDRLAAQQGVSAAVLLECSGRQVWDEVIDGLLNRLSGLVLPCGLAQCVEAAQNSGRSCQGPVGRSLFLLQ